jgi:transcriptional regulator with XRE-family HTH domain
MDRQEIGVRIRRVRDLRRLSQAELAAVAGRNGRTARWLQNVESGSSDISYQDARAVADRLGVRVGVLLCLEPIPEAVLLQGRPASRRPTSRAGSDLQPSTSARPLAAVAIDGATGDPDVAAMEAFRIADRQVGGGRLYPGLISYLNASIGPRLLTSRSAPFHAAASLTAMAGWMAHDTGRDTTARAHFDRAWLLAQVGNAKESQGDIAAARAHLELHLGDPQEAVRTARKGRADLAGRPRHPGLLARLHAMEARGLAVLGGPKHECVRLLHAAEVVLGHPADEPSPWTAPFDEASLASEAAWTLHSIRDFSAARRAAERVIELRQRDRARSRAFAQLALALILISQPRPEPIEACAVGLKVIEESAAVSSVRINRHLMQLRRKLERYRMIRDVAEFLLVFDATPFATPTAIEG